jgi:hypothetical protein
LALEGNTLFVATEFGGVSRSTDDGNTWEQINEGLPVKSASGLAIGDGYLFVGTSASVWRRPLSQIATSVTDPASSPQRFRLWQNYPNPFNPSTTIRYELPHAAFVTLKIYNSLGQEVATLLDENRPAGVYTIEFEGKNLSSGVYFYRFTSDQFTQTRNMIIVK